MGLLKKAATFTVVRIEGEIPLLAEIKAKIEGSATPDINGTSAPEAFSLCKVSDVFDKSVIQGETALAFGMRHDKKTISKSLFKKKYSEALKKLKYEAKLAKRKVDKDEKALLKENILGELYAEAKPIEKLVEVIWDTSKNVAYVGSASKMIVDAFVVTMMKLFPHLTFAAWMPLQTETKHVDRKGSKDHFQNAFFTWIFYETKIKRDKFWIPLNIKFLNDSAQVTIKGDTEISLESYLSVYHGRLVDGLDLGYTQGEQQYELSLSRGSWAFKKLLIKPEMVHENLDSAVFERSRSFHEVTEKFVELVREFESIRNDDTKDLAFWKSLNEMASKKIKEGLGEEL